jgi:hypothetical protein
MPTLTRTPPAAIRRQLRQEVGFACPAPDGGSLCGSPYLTWHHFDPPWREGHSHDVEGMVALCLAHHTRADAGAFTVEQLRAMKSCRPDEPIRGVFDWRREQLVLRAGAMTAVNASVVLQFGEQPAIWFSSDEQGNQLLNLDVCGIDGDLLFSMRGNEWLMVPAVDDLECPPSGKSLVLRAPSHGVSLNLRFSSVTRDELPQSYVDIGTAYAREKARALENSIEQAEAGGAPADYVARQRDRRVDIQADAEKFVSRALDAIARETDAREIALCDLTGEFAYPSAMRIEQGRIVQPGGSLSFGGHLASGNGIGILIQDYCNVRWAGSV